MDFIKETEEKIKGFKELQIKSEQKVQQIIGVIHGLEVALESYKESINESDDNNNKD